MDGARINPLRDILAMCDFLRHAMLLNPPHFDILYISSKRLELISNERTNKMSTIIDNSKEIETGTREWNIEDVWNDEENWALEATRYGITSSIDRDQAVDEDGQPIYNLYTFIEIDGDATAEFTANEVARFAKGW